MPVGVGTEVALAFSANEPLVMVQAAVADTVLPQIAVTCATDVDCAARYIVPEGASDGPLGFSIVVQDAVGNTAHRADRDGWYCRNS